MTKTCPTTRKEMLEAFPELTDCYKAKNQVILILKSHLCATQSRRYDSRSFEGWRKEINWLRSVL